MNVNPVRAAALLLFAATTTIAAPIGDGPVVREHFNQHAIESGDVSLKRLIDGGEFLFAAKFNTFDGQGRPGTTGGGAPRLAGSAPRFIRTSAPDANSCAGCHNDPAPGGAGEIVMNVFVLSQTLDPVNPSVDAEFSNERNTLGMHGSGIIETLAREMSTELASIRQAAIDEAQASGAPSTRALLTKGVSFGAIIAAPDGTVDTSRVEGVNSDLIVRPFHQKGVVVSLREFTNNAYNHHHGMQSVERFGSDRTGTSDFDQDGITDELTVGDITAATIWQAALNTPGQVIPTDEKVARAILRGESTFARIGCAECHVPEMTLSDTRFMEPNPFNPAGNLRPEDVSRPFTFDLAAEGQLPRPERDAEGRIIVRAFTDLKRHDLCDEETPFLCNERVVQGGVPVEQFLTRKLWDCGSSAPWGHRGDVTTLTEIIEAHGGEGRESRRMFRALPAAERAEVIEFLKSLRVLPEGTPALVVDEAGNPVNKGALAQKYASSRHRAVRP